MVPLTPRIARAVTASLLLALATAPSRASGQARASAYFPLDDPAASIVDALVARGALPALSALERPYRAHDVRAAVQAALADSASASRRAPLRWYREVLRAATRYDARLDAGDTTLRGTASLVPFVTAQTTGRRELMLADSAGDGVYPGVDVRVSLEAPTFVGVTRVRVDRALKADPEFAGKADRVVAGRLEEAYVAARWRWASLDAGRVARNWGPSPLDGLQLGNYADSWDHVQLVLGTDRLHLMTVVARLDDMRVGSDTTAQRYFAIHRLTARWRGVEVAASEAVVYGGPARGFDLGLSNPFGFYDLAQYDEGKSLNVSYGLDVAVRTTGRGLYAAQLLVDDFQIDHCDSNCKEPPSLGLTLSAESVPLPLGTGSAAFASYTRVDNLTYRTVLPWERYASLGLGLGRGQSDYDELRAGIELDPHFGGPVRLYGALRRQGEGDYRLPFPPRSQYAMTPELLAGVVERVTRAGAQWSTTGPAALSLDAGYQRTRNADHVAGRERSGFEARVRVSLPDPLRLAATLRD